MSEAEQANESSVIPGEGNHKSETDSGAQTEEDFSYIDDGFNKDKSS